MTVQTKQELMWHLGHDLEVAFYGKKDDPVSVTIECITCGSVLVNFEDYNVGVSSWEEKDTPSPTPYEQGRKRAYDDRDKDICGVPYSVCPFREGDKRRYSWTYGYLDGHYDYEENV